MLVFIGFTEFDLADSFEGAVAVDFRQRFDFYPPVSGDAVNPGQVRAHREFSCQGVAEAVQVDKKRQVPEQFFQTPDDWSDEQAGDPAVHAVGDPGIIAFAEGIINVG